MLLIIVCQARCYLTGVDRKMEQPILNDNLKVDGQVQIKEPEEANPQCILTDKIQTNRVRFAIVQG